jgi:hypothetical protein
MTSQDSYGRTPTGALLMSPFDHVRAQLGRQKWAVDSHNEGALYNIYTRDCTLTLKQDGVDELARVRGRTEIIAMMVKGWKANVDWRPGSMIHHIGTLMIEAAPEGMIRCWSYATYVHLSQTGATEIHGYGKYHDLWAEEDHIWRLHEREVHVFGLKLPRASGG